MELLIVIGIIIGFLLFVPFIVIGTLWFFEEVYGRYIDWISDRLGF